MKFQKIVLSALIAVAAMTAAVAEPLSIKSESGGTYQIEKFGQGEIALIFVHGAAGMAGWRAWPADAGAKGFLPISVNNTSFATTPVLAAVKYAQDAGAKKIVLVGASKGGEVIGAVSALLPPSLAQKLVFVSPQGYSVASDVVGEKLVLISKYERDARWMEKDFEVLKEPKQKIMINSGTHGHALVADKPELIEIILEFAKK
jgi:pimeloyl-ACP methyl ester carboxylesterase